MHTDFISKYSSSNEDKKMNILMNVTQPINNNIYQFLLNELNFEDDEFVLIEIIKVLSLYSPSEYNKELVKKIFEIIKSSDDDLIQSYAMQGLGYLELSDMDYKIIKEIIKKTDNENVVASGSMILCKNK